MSKIKWELYNLDENNFSSFMVIDKKKNLKMSSDSISFKGLAEMIYTDNRLNEIEKCVVLYQMFTYVGNDIYDQNMNKYPGNCNRKVSEDFIINNAGVIDYD